MSKTESGADSSALVSRVLDGDRAAIARLISRVESGAGDAAPALAELYPHTGRAYTVGLTGAPGAGKSTLTDKLIGRIRRDGDAVGVLAVDPTSPFTGGAILGDRVRMQEHATDASVFIRSMATRGHLGGLALATPQAIRVLDAAGKAWILVETVGVGQVEVEVAGAADTTIVVVNPGWGDAVQAAKAGLLEIADCFVVNKADRPGARAAVQDLDQMLDLAPGREWRPPIVETIAAENQGIDELFEAICSHRDFLERTGTLEVRRRDRLREEVRSIVIARLVATADATCSGEEFEQLLARVQARELDPYAAARRLLPDEGSPDRS